MDIFEEIGKRSVHNLLQKGVRIDNRKHDEYRSISVQKNVIPNANGSALARIGKSQVLAAVKFDIGAPYPDKPDEGTMSFNAELPALASPTFEIGPPSEQAIEFARVVDRGIRGSEIIDFKKLVIDAEKVLIMYVDLYALDYDGNLFDAGYLASMAALKSTRFPKIEEGKQIYGEYSGMLECRGDVVSSTFSVISNHILLDPNKLEESAMDAGMVVATHEENICAIQKLGFAGLEKKQILQMVDIAFEKSKELKKFLE